VTDTPDPSSSTDHHDHGSHHGPHSDDPIVHDPKTGAPMDKVHVGTDQRVTIDRNPTTGAVWLDGGELAVLLGLTDKPKDLVKTIDSSRRVRNMPAGEVVLICPRDGEPLVVVGDTKRKHVEFEACPACGGVYFDAGELRQISAASVKDRLRAMLR
jgi:Zn-finger nucleic acid-binding protein